MKRKFVFSGRLVAAAILLAPAALAQEAQPQKPAPFVASLMLLKADWSQVPAAKEIDFSVPPETYVNGKKP